MTRQPDMILQRDLLAAIQDDQWRTGAEIWHILGGGNPKVLRATLEACPEFENRVVDGTNLTQWRRRPTTPPAPKAAPAAQEAKP